MRTLAAFGLALFVALFSAQLAVAQTTIFNQSSGEGTAVPELPAELAPEQVDGLLARLTDAEIRQLLADELRRRADEQTADDMSGEEALNYAMVRLAEMQEKISERLPRWFRALANLDDRYERVAERMAQAQDGSLTMVLAAALIVALGFGAGAVVSRLTRGWRIWLTSPPRSTYWDKVIRTVLLGLVEILPIVAFAIVTPAAIRELAPTLGPLVELNWIYPIGVIYSWVGLVLARRLFAPDAPSIRIAPLDDVLAGRVYRVFHLAAVIAASAWVAGGLWLHLGFGFPPALLTVAAGGTGVAGVLLYAVLGNIDRLRDATHAVVGGSTNTLSRIAVSAAPWAMAGYVVLAYLFWLAHWLERGQHELHGPVGTLLVYITLPIFDRLGQEVIRSLMPRPGPVAERFRTVFFRIWRMVIGVLALILVVRLWGLDLIGLLASGATPGWVDTGADVTVTLLITWLIWQLIKAAMHSERKFVAQGEDVDPALAPQATRLDTLTPLFRGILLAFVAAIGFMFVLSSAGVDIGPLLASAGIIGIAVGFGAQALVRDIFSGMFFLIDDAFRVGDYIELSEELRGDVESISIRSLQLRHHLGPVITIPFGEMKHIINHTREWVIYKMSFRMEPETDPKLFKKLAKRVGAEFMEHPDHGPKFIEPVKSQGVYYVDDDSALVFRVKFKCVPRAQFVLRREIYHRLREVFEANGLKLSRRKVEVVTNDSNAPHPPRIAAVPDEVLESPV